MSDAPRIQVILGSTRPGRFGEKAAAWIVDRLDTAATDLVWWADALARARAA